MQATQLDRLRAQIDGIDASMAELFLQRMQAVEAVARYKKENKLGILDAGREAVVLSRAQTLVPDETLRKFYVEFLQATMDISKAYQAQLTEREEEVYEKYIRQRPDFDAVWREPWGYDRVRP